MIRVKALSPDVMVSLHQVTGECAYLMYDHIYVARIDQKNGSLRLEGLTEENIEHLDSRGVSVVRTGGGMSVVKVLTSDNPAY